MITHQQGVERDEEFREYADAHWSFDRYRYDRVNSHEWGSNEEIPDLNFHGEPVVGNQTGSHSLPGEWEDGYGSDSDPPDPYLDHFVVDRTQQYYEMIGKYAQFGRGWNDYGDGVNGYDGSWQGAHYFSPNNRHYMHLRDLSNEAFRTSSNMVMGLLLNHVISAADQILFGANNRVALTGSMTTMSSSIGVRLSI